MFKEHKLLGCEIIKDIEIEPGTEIIPKKKTVLELEPFEYWESKPHRNPNLN